MRVIRVIICVGCVCSIMPDDAYGGVKWSYGQMCVCTCCVSNNKSISVKHTKVKNLVLPLLVSWFVEMSQ